MLLLEPAYKCCYATLHCLVGDTLPPTGLGLAEARTAAI